MHIFWKAICIQNTLVQCRKSKGLKPIYLVKCCTICVRLTTDVILKMLRLYLYTQIFGHKSWNMLGILNTLTLKKELQKRCDKNVFLYKKWKITTTKQKVHPKNPWGSRKLNPGPLATKVDALPLHHRVNWKYWL